MCIFKKRRRQDRIARVEAARYNLLDEYLVARRNGLSPREALEEWDIPMPEEHLQTDKQTVVVSRGKVC